MMWRTPRVRHDAQEAAEHEFAEGEAHPCFAQSNGPTPSPFNFACDGRIMRWPRPRLQRACEVIA
jgi:hypothetical protein